VFNPFEAEWIGIPASEFGGIHIKRACILDRSLEVLHPAIGIDPGINFGVAWMIGNRLETWWGALPKQNHDYDYFYVARDFIIGFVRKFQLFEQIDIAIIEAPSYGSHYKQPLLEDVRVGFHAGLTSTHFTPEYVPPKTVNKAVFGNGNIAGKKEWLAVGGNGADAAAVTLYGGGYRFNG
jgi:hypothetical protein